MSRGGASMTESSRAVFLSYASDDAGAAKRIGDALRVAGIEVWFDQTELRGGDAWDRKIREQIRSCALFVPIISTHTQTRPEGYFRLEWKLAVDRSHLMAAEKAFLVPVVVDATTESEALVPAQFREVQWTRIPASEVPAVFVDRIAALLEQPVVPHVGGSESSVARARPRPLHVAPTVLSVSAVVAFLIAMAIGGGWFTRKPVRDVASRAVPTAVSATATGIPEKSVAVLPFLDMSEKKDQEYFSDGLSEELIDMLTKILELRVPARTSSFYFKGKQATVTDIAKTLNVAHVLEGSVRKSGTRLRITAQLVRADNGYHLWSETYDRQLDDIFKVQDEIAAAVVRALKVSLLERQAPTATLTTSSEAYELYMQAGSLLGRGTSDDALTAYADLQQALRLDPKFALAWARLARLLSSDYVDWSRVFKPSDSTSQSSAIDQSPRWGNSGRNWGWSWAHARAAAQAAAGRAIKLGPDLGESHEAMGVVLASVDWDWMAADAEFKKARELEPSKAEITLSSANLAMFLGRVSEGLQLAKRATAQDPLGDGWGSIAYGQYISGDLDEAQKSYRKLIELYPTATAVHAHYALVLLARGEPQAALSEFERDGAPWYRDVYRPFALDALGRRSEADSSIAVAEQKWGNGMAWNIASFYAARNDSDRAFYWLERAYRQHDGGMAELKGYPMFRNLQRDPRYRALLRKVNLPE